MIRIDNKYWQEIPDEDLWEDGELNSEQVKEKLSLYEIYLFM